MALGSGVQGTSAGCSTAKATKDKKKQEGTGTGGGKADAKIDLKK
jgi:hypothetical protein